MALTRVPSQFSPDVGGGPATPSCGGCCCCCCCVGTLVAGGIALPLLLQQQTKAPAAGAAEPSEPTAPAASDEQATANRRTQGIVLAALAVPVVTLVLFAVIGADQPWIFLGLAAGPALAIWGYLHAGLPTRKAIGLPLAIFAVGSAFFYGELILWLSLENWTIPFAIALPVLTIVFILALHRMAPQSRG